MPSSKRPRRLSPGARCGSAPTCPADWRVVGTWCYRPRVRCTKGRGLLRPPSSRCSSHISRCESLHPVGIGHIDGGDVGRSTAGECHCYLVRSFVPLLRNSWSPSVFPDNIETPCSPKCAQTTQRTPAGWTTTTC